jgi:hypothetical protein
MPVAWIESALMKSSLPRVNFSGKSDLRQPWSFVFFALLAIVLWRGVLPAFHAVSSDFPNYYVAARLLITGQAGNGIYQNAWFGTMAEHMGLSRDSRFIPFPPPTIFLMAPVALLGALNALRLWTVINIVFAAVSIRLLALLSYRDWRWCGTILLLSGNAIINNFKFGQAYIALMLTLILFVRDAERGKRTGSALWLGTGIALKYFPAVYLPLLVVRRQWRLIIWAAAAVLAFWLSAGAFMGPRTVMDFLTRIAVSHFQGNIVGQSNDAVLFQSWNSLFRRAFVHEPWGYALGLGVIYCALVCIFSLGWKSLAHYDHAKQFKQQFAYITVAAFVVLPASATYHCLLLAPALVFYLAPLARYNRFELITLFSYVAIGLFPYSWTSRFAEQPWLLPLAYPRLLLISVMFIAMTSGFRRRALQLQHVGTGF